MYCKVKKKRQFFLGKTKDHVLGNAIYFLLFTVPTHLHFPDPIFFTFSASQPNHLIHFVSRPIFFTFSDPAKAYQGSLSIAGRWTLSQIHLKHTRSKKVRFSFLTFFFLLL